MIWYTEIFNMTIDVFVCNAQQTLVDQFIQEWYIELNTSDKLRTYTLFKTIFAHENYLCNIISVKMRQATTRFRVSSHALEIEIGRYPPRLPVNRRICRQCT